MSITFNNPKPFVSIPPLPHIAAVTNVIDLVIDVHMWDDDFLRILQKELNERVFKINQQIRSNNPNQLEQQHAHQDHEVHD